MFVPGIVASKSVPPPSGSLSVTITFPADFQFDNASFAWLSPSVGAPGTVSVTGGTEPYSYQWTETGSAITSITDDTTANPTINTALFGGGNPNGVMLTVTDADLTVESDTAVVNIQAA